MSLSIQILGRDDAAVLDRVAPDVFDGSVDPEQAKAFLREPNHILCVAFDADLVVGFASAVRHLHPDKRPQLWVNEVGVAPTHQRRGIGKAILDQILEHGREIGCDDVWVLTENDNEAARALYRSVGGSETLDVVMATFGPTRHRGGKAS